ncbi:hypothetical protein ABZ069_31870 [Streptomyces microflavus]|uniref:hypothetical protein n=1 Tax=Streptomyces microflavus TaxID=1919 RepID=UPI0033BAC125
MSTKTTVTPGPGNSDAARGPALTASSEHNETTAKQHEHSGTTVREATDSTQGNAPAPTVPGRPAGVDHGDAAYWARIHRIVSQAPPLTDGQRATIRAALSQPATQPRAGAA